MFGKLYPPKIRAESIVQEVVSNLCSLCVLPYIGWVVEDDAGLLQYLIGGSARANGVSRGGSRTTESLGSWGTWMSCTGLDSKCLEIRNIGPAHLADMLS